MLVDHGYLLVTGVQVKEHCLQGYTAVAVVSSLTEPFVIPFLMHS